MRTFAVINQKGGCGKTTVAINLAAAFAESGHKSLLVDMDPQAHCALGLAVPEQQVDGSVNEALLAADAARFDAADVTWQITGQLDLIPSSVSLAALEHKLAGAPDKDLRLAKFLTGVDNEYAVCIIDCPPHIGLLTFNALRAASEVIVPVETGYFALQGSIKQLATIRMLADKCAHPVRVHVLATMYDVRTKMSREILGELSRQFADQVLPIPIHFNAKLREAASFGQPISEYDPHCRGHEDFVRLAAYLIEHETVEQAEAVLAEVASDESAQSAAAPASTAAAQPVTDPDGHANRAAELVQRAKALAKRTAKLQSQLAVDPDIARMDAEGDRPTDDRAARQQLEHRLQTLYGVRVTRQGTLFVQPDGDGVAQLSIAGDFNDWSRQATPMQRNDRLGIWEVCVPLAPGRYRYRLLVDGQWTSDPHNTYVETNPFGELNNIVEVGAELASN